MKFLFTTGIFVPEVGGPATYVLKLAENFVKIGHEVIVLAYSDKDFYDLDKNFSFKVVRVVRRIGFLGKILNYYHYYQQAKKLLNDNNFDVVYAFDHFSAGYPISLVIKNSKIPFFVRVGGDFIWERYVERSKKLITLEQFYNFNLHKTKEWLRFFLIQKVFARANKIIFTTKFQQDIFAKYYNLHQGKLKIINNPIDENIINKNEAKPNKDIVFFGRFNYIHNLFNLIEAFKNIKDKSFTLTLIGDGPLKNELQSIDLNNLKIVPKIYGQDLYNKLNQAWLVVVPSLTDISPNGLLECLALNIPIICTKNTGFSWLKDDVLLFDPTQPAEIAQLLDKLSDYNFRQEYKEKLRKINYHYNYQQATQDTLNIFKNV